MLSIKKIGYSFVAVPGGGVFDVPEVAKARFVTKAIIAAIVRGLRSGKAPKEIAQLTGESPENIRLLIHRYRTVHDIFVRTYPLRHPDKESLPKKMAGSLSEV